MICRFGDFEIDAALFELRRAGRRVAIEPKVFDLLSYLVVHAKRVVTRAEIFAAIWPNEFVSDAALAYAIRGARKAIDDDGRHQRFIRTVHRRGFQFVGTVARARDVAAPDAPPPPRPAPDLPFVGRERELADLVAALDAAAAGRGSVYLVSGEAGIGKTRLVAELAGVAAQRGARVLVGRCYEGDGAPAYAPWIDALGTFARAQADEDLAAALGENAADVAALIADIRARFGHLPALPVMDPERARFRLFDGVARFLARAAQRVPLLLVLDDLHWADFSSLLLLQFVAREIGASRVLAVGTHRDLLLAREHPLLQTLGSMARVAASRRAALTGLGAADVGAFVRAVSGIEAPESVIASIHRDTDGNPFFVTELVRVLAASAALASPITGRLTIPPTVRQAIAGHLGAVSTGCARTLEAAAVIGREFDVPLLAAVLRAELPDAAMRDVVLQAIDEALAVRLIEAADGQTPQARLRRYRFVHSLVREVVYEGLGTHRQSRLHGLVGEAMERLAPFEAARPSELAHHFANAGASARAVDHACAAAEQATAVMAYEEAASSYELALGQLGAAGQGDRRRCELLLSLAWSRWQSNDAVRARAAAWEAAAAARTLGAAEILAAAALSYGDSFRGFQIGVHDPELVELLESALAGLGTRASGLRARVLARLAVALFQVAGSEKRRNALSVESLRVSRRAADAGAELAALYSRHWAIWGPDSVADRLRAAEQMVGLAERLGDAEMSFHAHRFRFMDLLEDGAIAPLDRELALCEQLAGRLRQPYYRWYVDTFLALRAFLDGRFDDSERLAQQAAEVGQRAQNQNVMQILGVQIFALRREQGRLAELGDAIRGFVASYPNIPAWHAALALVCAETGDQTGARAELEHLAPDDFAALPRDTFWLGSMAGLADVCAVLGDAEHAAVLYELLRPFESLNGTLAPGAACNGSTARVLGRLSATLGKWERARRHFERALQKNGRLNAPHFVAHTQTQYAEMLLARGDAGDRTPASALLRDAVGAYGRLGMPAAEEAARKLASRARRPVTTRQRARQSG